ncbi:helix-turn-helix domain-containing protein [Streptomyces chartreusis]
MTRSPAGGSSQCPYARLAEHLIALRRTARLPQRALAEAAHISRGAVQRAESGTAAPSAAVLDAYLRACRASKDDQDKARLLRARGRAAQRDKLREFRAPSPALVRDERDLGLVLAEVYERAGAPSLRDPRLTPGRAPLPPTTAWRVVNRKGLPASREQLFTFLIACGIRHPAAQRPYIDAYEYVIAQRGARPVPPRAQRGPLAQRTVRRSQLVARAHGGPDTGALYDFDRLAAGIRPVMEAIIADPVVRTAPAAMAAGVQVFADAVDVMFRSASREAHRNGTTPPDWLTTTHLYAQGIDPARSCSVAAAPRSNDDGIDLIAHTADGGTVLYQAKTHRQRPGPPPALQSARLPEPPPPTTPSRCLTATTASSSPAGTTDPQGEAGLAP